MTILEALKLRDALIELAFKLKGHKDIYNIIMSAVKIIDDLLSKDEEENK